MAQAIHDLGGKIHCNAPVRQVSIEQAVQTLLPEGQQGKYTKAFFDRKQFFYSTFMLYLGLDRCYDLPHHQIYLSEHVRRRDQPFIDDSTLYVLVPIPHAGHRLDRQIDYICCSSRSSSCSSSRSFVASVSIC